MVHIVVMGAGLGKIAPASVLSRKHIGLVREAVRRAHPEENRVELADGRSIADYPAAIGAIYEGRAN